MKVREKVIVTVSILACCIAIAAFAMVSLGRFISTPSKTNLPVVGRMYESTIQQIALLDSVTVPQTSPNTSGTKSSHAPTQDQSAAVTAKNHATGPKQAKHKASDQESDGIGDTSDEDESYQELRAFVIDWYKHQSINN